MDHARPALGAEVGVGPEGDGLRHQGQVVCPGRPAQQVVGVELDVAVGGGELVALQGPVQRLLVAVQVHVGLRAHLVERGAEEDVLGIALEVWVAIQ